MGENTSPSRVTNVNQIVQVSRDEEGNLVTYGQYEQYVGFGNGIPDYAGYSYDPVSTTITVPEIANPAVPPERTAQLLAQGAVVQPATVAGAKSVDTSVRGDENAISQILFPHPLAGVNTDLINGFVNPMPNLSGSPVIPTSIPTPTLGNALGLDSGSTGINPLLLMLLLGGGSQSNLLMLLLLTGGLK